MSNVCGTGGWGGPKPGDPDNYVTISATPAFGGIDVSWTMPALNPYAVAHVLLYRGTSPSFSTAIEIAAVGGNTYRDMRNTGITYFYWLKIVSVNGTVNDPVGPASATARPLIDDFIVELTGKIDSGLLANSLKGQLDQISILNGNLLNEITDRETGETTLQQALTNVAEGVANANTFILNEIETRTTQNAALVETINGVVATSGSGVAATVLTLRADVDALTGEVNAIYTAKVTANGLVGGFGLSNNGAVVEAGFDVDRFWVGRTNVDRKKPFIIENGEVIIDKAVIGTLTADQIDATGMVIRNKLTNQIILDAGGVEPPLKWTDVGGSDKPENNATRNVFVGDWATNILYLVGDIVLDSIGYGWVCTVTHTSSAVANKLPVYPVKSNAHWTLYTVKGGDSLTGLLSNDTATVSVAHDGAVSPAVLAMQASGVFTVYLGTTLINSGDITFSLGAVTGCTATLSAAGEYALTTMTGSNASVVMTATYNGTGVTKEFTVAKSFPAVNYDVELESSNGTFFRIGNAANTVLKARVYRNAQEVTSELPASAFQWTRVSAIPRDPPYDDASWNALYTQGYKQITVSVDDVFARATFFCQISI